MKGGRWTDMHVVQQSALDHNRRNLCCPDRTAPTATLPHSTSNVGLIREAFLLSLTSHNPSTQFTFVIHLLAVPARLLCKSRWQTASGSMTQLLPSSPADAACAVLSSLLLARPAKHDVDEEVQQPQSYHAVPGTEDCGEESGRLLRDNCALDVLHPVDGATVADTVTALNRILRLVWPIVAIAGVLTTFAVLRSGDHSNAFHPAPVDSRCLCSHMYEWDNLVVETAAQPGRLPWRLSTARSYDEWDSCSALQPRSSLVHSAPALPGPPHDTALPSSSDVWQLPSCLAFDVWLRTSAPPDETPPASSARPLSKPSSSAFASASWRAPVFSLQYTVFNQETAVIAHLQALLSRASAREPFELVVVFDDCTDHSVPLVHTFLDAALKGCVGGGGGEWPQQHLPTLSTVPDALLPNTSELTTSCINPALVHVRTIVQPTSVWETTANNIGARAASPHSDYVVFIQDDQLVTQQDWNVVLAAPVRLWQEVVAVTARCAHNTYTVGGNGQSEHLDLRGRCSTNVGEPLSWSAQERCTFYIRDSGNRGPLLVRHSALRQLGYFDEVHFWLDNSDHDLLARAYQQLGGLVGMMAIDFVAPLHLGATRRSQPPLPNSTRLYLQARRERAESTVSGLQDVTQHEAVQWKLHDDDRPLPGLIFQRCIFFYEQRERQQQQSAENKAGNVTIIRPWYESEQLRAVAASTVTA